MQTSTWKTDIVVVGSGVAGLSAAVGAARAANARILILTKLTLEEGGCSPWAQGGVAAAVGVDDSPRLHAEDTLRVGRGLSDPTVVAELTAAGPEALRELADWGAEFDRVAGELALGQEGGHERRRILHAGGDATGREMVRALVETVRAEPRIDIAEGFVAEDLIVNSAGHVVGVLGLSGGRPVRVLAAATILATGGAGQIYRYTTNPAAVTGDGIAMAARAGAELVDLEFVQFHPTTVADHASSSGEGRSQVSLLTEALRGEGAWLIDAAGRRILEGVHPRGELAPRDVIARTLWQRDLDGLTSYLDLRPVRAGGIRLRERFPTALANCHAAGFDPTREPIPVRPAAHYCMGGIWTDSNGRSTLPGLWACGETAGTGVHGANRLASNSLLEALVFGRRAATASVGELGPVRSLPARPPAPTTVGPAERPPEDLAWRRSLQELCWRHVGVERDADGLAAAIEELDLLAFELGARQSENRNLLLMAQMVARAALARGESRGAHRRSDAPETSPELAVRRTWTLSELYDSIARRRERRPA